jgi:hypothetical protein
MSIESRIKNIEKKIEKSEWFYTLDNVSLTQKEYEQAIKIGLFTFKEMAKEFKVEKQMTKKAWSTYGVLWVANSAINKWRVKFGLEMTNKFAGSTDALLTLKKMIEEYEALQSGKLKIEGDKIV